MLEYYDQTVNSASGERFYIPAVLRVCNHLNAIFFSHVIRLLVQFLYL